MNLSKVKRGATKAMLFGMMMASVAGAAMPAYAADDNSIGIEKPSGWKQGETTITVTINANKLGEGVTITKLEAKVGENGTWTDITDSHSISISKNETVYVRATDSEGATYEQNRSIKCYDSEKPTLAASLTDGVLTIQGKDTISGIASITVNGTEYRDLTEGTLKIQLTQKDFTTKKIEITATDNAGNTSDKYSLQNPYYEWAVKQAIAQSADASGNNATTTTPTGDDQQVTSPLPQDAKPSEPTTSTGTVEDRTVTGIEQELAEQNETVDKISSTTTAAGKEFYTISTKSGKVFYLIIDNEQSQDNVYFLTEVDEQDLMNFTLSDTVTLPDVDTVYATVDGEDDQTETPATEAEKPEETETPEEPEVQEPAKTSNLGSYLLIGLLAAGVGAGAWYMKIYKPKHEFDDDDEYEEFDDDDSETYEKDDADSDQDYEPEVMDDEDD
ncbi:MAG: DUF4366 domain-containing protein [Eubacteriales bacterium]|nr:DUF4366 domain-containing protein [Eubacteriales bacterium]